MNPLLSVGIPVYNAAETLERCVGSVLAQTYRPIEVLLVDDGSVDGSAELCDSLVAKNPELRVIHRENGGVSSARNVALREARGQFMGFVDSDDWLDPRAYEALLSKMIETDAKMGLFSFTELGSDGSSSVQLMDIGTSTIEANDLIHRFLDISKRSLFASCWRAVFSLELQRSSETWFNERMITREDCLFMIGLTLAAGHVALVDEPLYNYCLRVPIGSTSSYVREIVTSADIFFAEARRLGVSDELLIPHRLYILCSAAMNECKAGSNSKTLASRIEFIEALYQGNSETFSLLKKYRGAVSCKYYLAIRLLTVSRTLFVLVFSARAKLKGV